MPDRGRPRSHSFREQDGAGADAGRPVDVGEADCRGSGHLAPVAQPVQPGRQPRQHHRERHYGPADGCWQHDADALLGQHRHHVAPAQDGHRLDQIQLAFPAGQPARQQHHRPVFRQAPLARQLDHAGRAQQRRREHRRIVAAVDHAQPLQIPQALALQRGGHAGAQDRGVHWLGQEVLRPHLDAAGDRVKLVDAVQESAKSLNRRLGKSDNERIDQYLTSLNEIESRLVASEKWIDIPIKSQDYSHLNLDATTEGEPAEYYRNMFDLISLVFDADITRSVAFMLNREDGMGISDTFPVKLGLNRTHHNLSHAEDKDGQLAFAKYDLFLSEQIAYFLNRLNQYQDMGSSVLDNTIVLFGSGASTTHNPTNLPTLVAGGSNMGLKHGTYWRKDRTPMSNVYLSILRSMGIEEASFGDSTGTVSDSIFTKV